MKLSGNTYSTDEFGQFEYDDDGNVLIKVGDETLVYTGDNGWKTESINLRTMDVIDAGKMFHDSRGVPSVNVIVKEKLKWMDKDARYEAVIFIPHILDGHRVCQDKLNCTVSNCCGNMMTVSIPYFEDLEVTVGSALIMSECYTIGLNDGK